MNIKIIRSAAAGAGLTALGLAALLLPQQTAAAPAPQHVRTLTLARVDRKCFEYPSAPGDVVTNGRRSWRTQKFVASCKCWQIDDATWHPST